MTNSALILAGGDGLRMRPLTCTRPKAMLPVCGAPLISYTLAALKRQGFGSVLIAADRLSNVITDCLDEDENLDFLISPSPEGGCRALGEALKICGTDALAVISGDLLFDMDLNGAIAAHREASADITVVTAKTDRPAAGALAAVKDGFVTDIIPAPARESCISDLAVTGIFIVSPSAAAEAERCGDILTELIPSVIKNGGRALNYTAEGIFIDVNVPEDLFTASSAVLEGKIRGNGHIIKTREERPELKISAPAYIASSADVAPQVEIGAGTVIGENVTVCRGAKINGSIIMDGAFIGERATANGAVIGAGARLLAGASVFEGSVTGDCAVIAEQAVVRCGVKIWNGRHIDSYACASQDVKYGFLTPVKIGEDGICGETGSSVTPQTAALAGSALASLGGKIGIGFRDTPASKSLALAAAAGVAAAGAEAWLFGVTTAPALYYCTAKSRLSAGCWFDAGITAKIRFCSADGLPLSRSEEKIIEGGINRSEYRRAGFNHFGVIRNTAAIVRLYKNMLEDIPPHALRETRAVLNTSGSAVTEMCGGIFSRISEKNGKPIVFHIGADGTGTSAYTEETGYVFEEKLTLICCARRFEQGQDIALPYDFPQAADRLAERYGRKVLRYSGCPSDKGDSEARRLAVKTPFVRDGAALALSVLEALESRGMTLAQAVAELPEMALATRFVAVDRHPVQLLRKICAEEQASGDGIVVSDKRGRVMIRPVKTEKGVLMRVESFSMEAASELCDFYQDRLRELSAEKPGG